MRVEVQGFRGWLWRCKGKDGERFLSVGVLMPLLVQPTTRCGGRRAEAGAERWSESASRVRLFDYTLLAVAPGAAGGRSFVDLGVVVFVTCC